MLISLKVKAGAKREEWEKLSNTRFALSVREEARNNAANRRVLAVVALQFGVPEGKVRIISGHHSPSKIVEISS